VKHGITRDMGAKHALWFVRSAETTGWLRETELVPKTQGIVSAVAQTKFALKLATKGKVPLPFPPHVAENVDEARKLHRLVQEQGRDGAAGIVQGEHALAALGHGFEPDRDPYDREDAFPAPFLPGEPEGALVTGEVTPKQPTAPRPAGGDAGMGSRAQADVTPGTEPTRKPEGGA
jgi:hypothetical protein